MKSGICPKCGGNKIKCFQPRIGNASVVDREYVGTFRMARSTRYVCLDCGYSERYFEDNELEKIREKVKKENGEF